MDACLRVVCNQKADAAENADKLTTWEDRDQESVLLEFGELASETGKGVAEANPLWYKHMGVYMLSIVLVLGAYI
jgi:hypothetical protein